MKDTTAWHNFILNCDHLNGCDELDKFFELVLTPAEREKIAARYQILSELTHGKLIN